MNQYYVSKERLEELKRELEEQKTVKRREVADRLKLAKEYGDLAENAEYAEAKEEQGRVERRIFDLEELLKHAVVIQEGKGAKDEVRIGATVSVRKGNETIKYQIVGSSEAKPEEGKISNESPIGKALLGHKVGDKVTVQTPGGEESYAIMKVE
jgi:transcription elongation factor GreA